jgi:hypothetical protein
MGYVLHRFVGCRVGWVIGYAVGRIVVCVFMIILALCSMVLCITAIKVQASGAT